MTTQTGFIIYLQNIVKNLKGLDDQFRPELTVLYSANSPLEDLKKIGYPYATYYNIEKPLAVWVRPSINSAGLFLENL
jgi:hypothetical protein